MPAPKRMKVIGRIAPGELYTREGCMRFAGLGHQSLIAAVKSGIVKPVGGVPGGGGRLYYKGEELIAWIASRVQNSNEQIVNSHEG